MQFGIILAAGKQSPKLDLLRRTTHLSNDWSRNGNGCVKDRDARIAPSVKTIALARSELFALRYFGVRVAPAGVPAIVMERI